MRRAVFFSLIITGALLLCGCASGEAEPQSEQELPQISQEQTEPILEMENEKEEEVTEKMLALSVDGREIAVTWADNAAVKKLKELAESGDITFATSAYGGFEQVGQMPYSLPTENEYTTTQAGDIMLYGGDSMVLFYGSNSWQYTHLGRMENLSAAELAEILGGSSAQITITLR